MTLRVVFEIVPHGDESRTYEIACINISNVRTTDDLGFGNKICDYEYTVTRPLPEILQKDGEWEEEIASGEIKSHNRRHGAVQLVKRVLDTLESF